MIRIIIIIKIIIRIIIIIIIIIIITIIGSTVSIAAFVAIFVHQDYLFLLTKTASFSSFYRQRENREESRMTWQ